MTYYYRAMVFMSLVLMTLVTAVVYSGHQRPVMLSLLFANPAGQPCQGPCLLGIQPGETSYEHALGLAQMHPYTHGFESLTSHTFRNHGFTLLLETTTDNRVSEIDLVRISAAPELPWASFGEFVAILGAPDRVQVVQELGGDFLTAVYLSRDLLARFRLRTPIYADAELQLISVSSWRPVVSPDMSAWIGFGNRYPEIHLFP